MSPKVEQKETPVRANVIVAPSREFEPRRFHLFLAGGITNCPDWQKEMIGELAGNGDLNMFNPRRPSFPIDDPNAAPEQIAWEYKYLEECPFVLFWFSRGSLNPIVLYELGMWGNSRPDKTIFVGADPEYQRKQDVVIQTRLARPDIVIAHSIPKLAEQVQETLKKLRSA